jgi:hypothetical protein
MKGIYEFYWDCGRSGDLQGIFVADSEDIAQIMGKEVYFGEVLGKHSEVRGMIEAKDIELKTDDQAFIAQFEAILGERFESGFNPLSYWEPSEDDNEEDEEDEE